MKLCGRKETGWMLGNLSTVEELGTVVLVAPGIATV